jgi:hypothetical protein
MQAGAISQLRTFPGTATDALRLRTSPVASVDGAVKFWPDVSKTRLLIEGARVLTGVQRDEVATTSFASSIAAFTSVKLTPVPRALSSTMSSSIRA